MKKPTSIVFFLLLVLLMATSLSFAENLTPTSHLESVPDYYYGVTYYDGGFLLTPKVYKHLLIPTGYTYVQSGPDIEFIHFDTEWNGVRVKQQIKYRYKYSFKKR